MVPTWNHEVVHVPGVVSVHHDAEFLESVVRDLTDAALKHRSRENLGEAAQPRQDTKRGMSGCAGELPADFG